MHVGNLAQCLPLGRIHVAGSRTWRDVAGYLGQFKDEDVVVTLDVRLCNTHPVVKVLVNLVAVDFNHPEFARVNILML